MPRLPSLPRSIAKDFFQVLKNCQVSDICSTFQHLIINKAMHVYFSSFSTLTIKPEYLSLPNPIDLLCTFYYLLKLSC